jgi:hypothetical protein
VVLEESGMHVAFEFGLAFVFLEGEVDENDE